MNADILSGIKPIMTDMKMDGSLDANVVRFPQKLGEIVKELKTYETSIWQNRKEPKKISFGKNVSSLITLYNNSTNVITNAQTIFDQRLMLEQIRKIYKGTIQINRDNQIIANKSLDKGIVLVFEHSYVIMLKFLIHVLLRKIVLQDHESNIKQIVKPEIYKLAIQDKINAIIKTINEIRLFYIRHLNELKLDPIETFIEDNKDAISLIPAFVKVYSNLNTLLNMW
jgi:hypothetical protein